jgi:hypothetical protein
MQSYYIFYIDGDIKDICTEIGKQDKGHPYKNNQTKKPPIMNTLFIQMNKMWENMLLI